MEMCCVGGAAQGVGGAVKAAPVVVANAGAPPVPPARVLAPLR